MKPARDKILLCGSKSKMSRRRSHDGPCQSLRAASHSLEDVDDSVARWTAVCYVLERVDTEGDTAAQETPGSRQRVI